MLHVHLGAEAKWRAFDEPLTPAARAVLHDARTSPRDARTAALGEAASPLLAELARDGRTGVVDLARATGWSKARVSARLEELLDGQALRLAVDLAYARFGFHTTAYLWLTVSPGRLRETGDTLSRHPETTFAAAVTGSAGLLVTVTCRTMDDLYTYVTDRIGVLPAVTLVDVVPVLHRLKQAGTRLHQGRLTPT